MCSQDGVDTVQHALVVFFLGALAHLLMCTQMNRHILQLALCGGGRIFLCGGGYMWWWSYVVLVDVHRGDGHLYMCGSGCITV